MKMISLGLGSPASIAVFLLVGLSPTGSVTVSGGLLTVSDAAISTLTLADTRIDSVLTTTDAPLAVLTAADDLLTT